MASASGSRAGLITSVVILAIVTVTATVFAFIFSAEASKNRKDLEQISLSYNEVVKRNALQGPTVVSLREARDSTEGFTKSDQLLDVAARQRDDLARLVGGQNATIATAAAKEALADAAAKLTAAKLPGVSTTEDLAGTVKILSNTVASLAAQNADLTRAAEEAKKQAAQTVADTTAQLGKKDEDIAAARAEAAKAREEAQQVKAAGQGVADEINKRMEEERKAMADAQQKLSNKAADDQRTIARLQKDVDTFRAKYNAYRPDAAQSTVRAADAKITRVADSGTVYIDIGAGNQVVPGMTFEVYDRVGGVPAMKNDDTSLPVGKGSVEVIRVGPNTAECRVVKTASGRTITEGDVVSNLVYDRNTKYNFVVYGKFELTKKGTPDAADAAVMRRLVTEWGANLQTDVTPATDFVVIGSEPKIPEFTEEQRRDPVNAKILTDAQAELDAYLATLKKANDLSIPVLNQNRFLYYVGYYEQARR